jgi:hypothetical protein
MRYTHQNKEKQQMLSKGIPLTIGSEREGQKGRLWEKINSESAPWKALRILK